MAEPVRAKDVTVEKVFRARCYRPGCTWTGGEHPTFAKASDERSDHLTWHVDTFGQVPEGGEADG